MDVGHLFIFIGAQPGSDFLGDSVSLDADARKPPKSDLPIWVSTGPRVSRARPFFRARGLGVRAQDL